MKAFLLAAGRGERLRPLTERIPKPLVPVLNVPAICYALTMIREAGIARVVINLHHLGGDIRSFFSEHGNFGLDVTFSDEMEILGTGGGLENCRAHLSDGPFLYINSDTIVDIDLRVLVAAFDRARAGGLMAVSLDSDRGGRVAVRDGRVVNLRNILPSDIEPRFDFIGIAVLSPAIFRHLKKGFSDIVETGFIGLVRGGDMACLDFTGCWHDIGTVESYRRANLDLIARCSDLGPRVRAATGLVPAAVSAGARIEPGARVIDSVIGDGCVIEAGALVRESVVLPGARVRGAARLEACVVS